MLSYVWHYGRAKGRQRIVARSGISSGNRFLFVTGFDKSGTTWLKNLLNSHPNVYCQASGQFFNLVFDDVHFLGAPGGYQIMMDELLRSSWYVNSGKTWITELALDGLVRKLIANAMNSFLSNDELIIGDKSVVQNPNLIRKVFPKAQIICIVRDGRDIVVSFAKQFLRKGDESKITRDGILKPNYLTAVAIAWSLYNNHLLDYSQTSDANFYLLKYENLLANTNEELEEIYKFLRLNASESIVTRSVHQNSFEVMSGGRKPGEEDPADFFRKGVSGDWKNYFGPDEFEIFNHHAGATLKKLEYEQIS